MALFDPDNRNRSADHRKVYALYEVAYTLVDFAAAFLFIVGSGMFFYKSLENGALWCFLAGSVCFALKPTIRTVREFHLLAMGDFSDLAERVRQ